MVKLRLTGERVIPEQMNPRSGLLKEHIAGGVVVISTPFGSGRGVACSNPYHVQQYTEADFRHLLAPFGKVRIYHQLDECIEDPRPGRKYYLMVAVCH